MVESTGFWYWLADLLDEFGVDLVPAHAPRLKAIAAANVKTDRLDADLLVQLLRADFIPAPIASAATPAGRAITN